MVLETALHARLVLDCKGTRGSVVGGIRGAFGIAAVQVTGMARFRVGASCGALLCFGSTPLVQSEKKALSEWVSA